MTVVLRVFGLYVIFFLLLWFCAQHGILLHMAATAPPIMKLVACAFGFLMIRQVYTMDTLPAAIVWVIWSVLTYIAIWMIASYLMKLTGLMR